MRKKIETVIIISGFIIISFLSGCQSRSEFNKGYDLGSSDTAKKQYWAIINLQKQKSNQQSCQAQYRTVSIPINGKNKDGDSYSPHFVKTRILVR